MARDAMAAEPNGSARICYESAPTLCQFTARRAAPRGPSVREHRVVSERRSPRRPSRPCHAGAPRSRRSSASAAPGCSGRTGAPAAAQRARASGSSHASGWPVRRSARGAASHAEELGRRRARRRTHGSSSPCGARTRSQLDWPSSRRTVEDTSREMRRAHAPRTRDHHAAYEWPTRPPRAGPRAERRRAPRRRPTDASPTTRPARAADDVGASTSCPRRSSAATSRQHQPPCHAPCTARTWPG